MVALSRMEPNRDDHAHYNPPMPRTSPFLIAIAGPSGSGKTEIAGILARRLGPDTTVVPIDAYYRDRSDLPPDARAGLNFDDPDAIELPLLLRDLESLAGGQPIDIPTYDFDTHTRAPDTTHVNPGRFVIVEGLFALTWPDLRALFDLSVYVGANDALCLKRRIERDIRARGRSDSSVRARFRSMVVPMAERWVRPNRLHADLVIDGSQPAVQSVERIVAALATD